MTYDWRKNPVEAAHAVLSVAEGNNIAGVSIQKPGSFVQALTGSMFKADRHNLTLLHSVFPALANAVNLYKNVEGGRDALLEVVKNG